MGGSAANVTVEIANARIGTRHNCFMGKLTVQWAAYHFDVQPVCFLSQNIFHNAGLLYTRQTKIETLKAMRKSLVFDSQ
jgi:hypothetical protein